MPTLLIARPREKGADFPSLTRLLAELRRHGYRLAVVEAPAAPVLSRLADHALFVACEPTTQGACLRPLVVRLRELVTPTPILRQGAEIELMALPPQLAMLSRWLCAQFQSGLFEQAPASTPGPVGRGATLHRFLPACPATVTGQWPPVVDTMLVAHSAGASQASSLAAR